VVASREQTGVNVKGGSVSIWLVILIVVLVVLAFGGFGYRRRR
jgi:LPXTG-motif cell wall-anchored protein